MKKSDEKKALCVKHRELLQILVRFGRDAMLLKQLRAICLKTNLYPNTQAVNRAVRNLRAAGVLTRQTWVDGNSDLVLARKAVFEFLQGSLRSGPPRRRASFFLGYSRAHEKPRKNFLKFLPKTLILFCPLAYEIPNGKKADSDGALPTPRRPRR